MPLSETIKNVHSEQGCPKPTLAERHIDTNPRQKRRTAKKRKKKNTYVPSSTSPKQASKKSNMTGFPAIVDVASKHCLRTTPPRSPARKDLGVPLPHLLVAELEGREPEIGERVGFRNATRTEALRTARRVHPAADAPNITNKKDRALVRCSVCYQYF